MIISSIEQRTRRAEQKALPLIKKYDMMSLDERLLYIRVCREQFKREHNIINRYYNLMARGIGYAEGMDGLK